MAKHDKIEIRSEEVQEILGTPPSWLVRWGSTVALGTLVVMGWASYFIRYPDTVADKIKVTSTDPPRRIIVENTSFVSKIFVENEDTVQAGQVLLVYKSKAEVDDVLHLEDYLLSVKTLDDSTLLRFNPPSDLLLGDLQDEFVELVKRREALDLSSSRRYEKLSVDQLEKRIKQHKSVIRYERRKRENFKKQLEFLKEQENREKKQLNERIIKEERLQKTQAEILATERLIQGISSTIASNRQKIELIEAQISGVKRGSLLNKTNASKKLRDQFILLQNKIEDWRKKYVISSPVKGVVLITNETLGEQQFVKQNDELLVVVPVRETETKGRIFLNLDGSGKVRPGQQVIVKFDSYPFPEFGAVVGQVSWKGKVPNNNKIPIEVVFPEGLTTNTGRVIEPSQEMFGTAQIILEDKRFIERIFENFRRVFS